MATEIECVSDCELKVQNLREFLLSENYSTTLGTPTLKKHVTDIINSNTDIVPASYTLSQSEVNTKLADLQNQINNL